MKTENQVTSLELSKKLKELGVKQESLFSWIQVTKDVNGNPHPWQLNDEKDLYVPRMFAKEGRADIVSAFTVAELGEMLPNWTIGAKGGNTWEYDLIKGNPLGKTPTFDTDTEANSRAKLLIYLYENKLVRNAK